MKYANAIELLVLATLCKVLYYYYHFQMSVRASKSISTQTQTITIALKNPQSDHFSVERSQTTVFIYYCYCSLALNTATDSLDRSSDSACVYEYIHYVLPQHASIRDESCDCVEACMSYPKHTNAILLFAATSICLLILDHT